MKLLNIAHARSGDKGDTSNIAVIAYSQQGFELLEQFLTPDRVRHHLGRYVLGEVRRYVLPHLRACNFVLSGALGGGVTRSLRLDTHGKGLAAQLLMIEVSNAYTLADLINQSPSGRSR